MKSKLRKSTFKAIYRLLDRVSPVDYDCGTLCGAACCTCGGDSDDGDFDLGIYLLPGEDKLFTKQEDWIKWSCENAEDYEFPVSWHGKVYFIRCVNPPVCDRKMRSIQCRTYPLAPHIDDFGRLSLIYNVSDLPYVCPLIEDRITLNRDFIQATYTVWKHLIRDPLIYDMVEMDSQYRDFDGIEYKTVKEPE